MSFAVEYGTLQIGMDMIASVAFACILYLIGSFIKSKVGFLQKYCIPAPVIGGFLFMFLTWGGHATDTFLFTFNTALQAPLMLMFFATVGLGASLALLKKGGILLVIYWLIAGVISLIQNAIGVGMSTVLDYPAAYGLLAASISMVGGHGAAAAYGQTFYEMGYTTGPLVGAASATFGLISAVIVGGPVARRLIVKYDLKPDPNETMDTSINDINAASGEPLSNQDIFKNFTAIFICMVLGAIIATQISRLTGDITLPAMVGVMIASVVLRNVNGQKNRFYKFDFPLTDKIGDISLGIFLSMALMTLRIWDLAALALPLFLTLLAQVVFLVLAAYFIVFRLLGKNFDAAVMCAGLLGHGLGATPTAVVNLSAVHDRFGMSRKALLIVPIVGAFLVDIIYTPGVIWFINRFVG